MPMPKGHKSNHGYATVSTDGGLGYREIAEKMSAEGDDMNHSTARNVFLRAMKKIARDACQSVGASYDDSHLTKIASDPRFQLGLMDIITDESDSISI